MSTSCKERACVWPVEAHSLCRHHLELAGLIGRCPQCHAEFIQPHRRTRYRFCSRRCACRANNRAHYAVPRDRAMLEDLYLRRRLSLLAIGKRFGTYAATALRALRAVGIPARRPGRISTMTCIESGCHLPACKKENDRGYYGGRRCRGHALARHAAQHRQYRREGRMA